MAKPFKSEYDLMAEAYGNISYSKQRLINEDKAGRRVRGYTQQQGQLITEAEGTTLEIGGQTYTVGEQDPNDDGTIIEIEKHRNGYFITGGEYTDMQGEGSYADDRDNPKVGYGYALTLDGKPMDEDDLEDRDMDHDLSTVDRGTGRFEDAEGAAEFPDGEGKYEVADIGGMHGQGTYSGPEYKKGRKFNSLKDACAYAGCDLSEITSEEWIDMEGDGTTLEFAVDEDTAIVMHKNVGSSEDAEGSNIDQVEALTASISDGIIQLARLMDSEEMVDDDDLSIGAAATNALENLKAMLNNIV